MVISPNATFTFQEICEATGNTEAVIRGRIKRLDDMGVLEKHRVEGQRGRTRLYNYDEIKTILRPIREVKRELEEERMDYKPDPMRIHALRHQLETDGFTIRRAADQ